MQSVTDIRDHVTADLLVLVSQLTGPWRGLLLQVMTGAVEGVVHESFEGHNEKPYHPMVQTLENYPQTTLWYKP